MHLTDATLFFAPHGGGVKRYLLSKRRYLRSVAGVRHSLVVPGARTSAPQPDTYYVPAPRIPFGGGYRVPLRLAQWRDTLCRLQPDLIEVGDPYHLAWAALAAARRLEVPVVAFAHSDLSRLLGNRFGTLTGRATDAYLRQLYSRFDLVLAPSRHVAEHLRSIGIEQVAVQPLGVDTRIFCPQARDPELRRVLGLPPDTRLLVFAGRMAREKSIAAMRAAVESLGAPYHLLLVGAQRWRQCSARVTELPYQQNAQSLARLLASADALLHAGTQETFGLIILEAMACARPVIGVDAGAVNELIDPDVGRLAHACDVASLQAAIESLFDDDIEALGRRAQARVASRYTWETTLGAQLNLYARLARAQPVVTAQVAESIST